MKVAIVGGAPGSIDLAPYGDLEWEIWAHGNQMQRHEGRRVTRIFEIHDDLTEHDPAYPEWLVGMGIPMVVGEKFPLTADHVQVFPFGEARKFFGRDMLSSTPAYMMALALIEKFKEIGIYGVDMAVDDHEYFRQQPVMMAWIGLAMGVGVRLTIPESSGLVRHNYVEGRDHRKSHGTFTEAEFCKVAAMHSERAAALEAQIQGHRGAQQAYERLAKVARAVEAGQDVEGLTGSLSLR